MIPSLTLSKAALTLIVFAAVGAGCGDAPASVEGAPDLTGVVYAIDDAPPTATAPGRIWLAYVMPGPNRTPTPDTVGIFVRAETDIFIRRPATSRVAEFGDLERGQRVRVWHESHEYLSIPPQYDGVRLEIISDEIDLVVTEAEYAVGDTIELVLSNGSDADVGYNLCVADLERMHAGEWQSVPRQPGNVVCTMELRILKTGQRATAHQPVFDWMEPGEYRFRVLVEWPLGGGRTEVISQVFRIRSD